MTVDPRLLSLLRERAGLRTAALEGESGVALVRRRMQAVGVASETEYLDRLNCDPAEFEALAAAVAPDPACRLARAVAQGAEPAPAVATAQVTRLRIPEP